MSSGELLEIDPLELKFPCKFHIHALFLVVCVVLIRGISFVAMALLLFCSLSFCLILVAAVELKKQISCSIQLKNNSDNHIAFKVATSLILPSFTFYAW